jgi:hypothetical protein
MHLREQLLAVLALVPSILTVSMGYGENSGSNDPDVLTSTYFEILTAFGADQVASITAQSITRTHPIITLTTKTTAVTTSPLR